MSKLNITKLFFVFNPKSYLYGKELLKLAKMADKLAKENDISIFVTAPFADLQTLSKNTEDVIVTAQHMDGIKPGREMGHVLPDSLHANGAQATFLNNVKDR